MVLCWIIATVYLHDFHHFTALGVGKLIFFVGYVSPVALFIYGVVLLFLKQPAKTILLAISSIILALMTTIYICYYVMNISGPTSKFNDKPMQEIDLTSGRIPKQ
jgi:hypothetical protein